MFEVANKIKCLCFFKACLLSLFCSMSSLADSDFSFAFAKGKNVKSCSGRSCAFSEEGEVYSYSGEPKQFKFTEFHKHSGYESGWDDSFKSGFDYDGDYEVEKETNRIFHTQNEMGGRCLSKRKVNLDRFDENAFRQVSPSYLESEYLLYGYEADELISDELCVSYFDIFEIAKRLETLNPDKKRLAKKKVQDVLKKVNSANKGLAPEKRIYGFHVIQMLDASTNITESHLGDYDTPIISQCIRDIAGNCRTNFDGSIVRNPYRPTICKYGKACEKGTLNLAMFYTMLDAVNSTRGEFSPEDLSVLANTFYTKDKNGFDKLVGLLKHRDAKEKGYTLIGLGTVFPVFGSKAAVNEVKKAIDKKVSFKDFYNRAVGKKAELVGIGLDQMKGYILKGVYFRLKPINTAALSKEL